MPKESSCNSEKLWYIYMYYDFNHIQVEYFQILLLYGLKTFLNLSHFNVEFINKKEHK